MIMSGRSESSAVDKVSIYAASACVKKKKFKGTETRMRKRLLKSKKRY